MCLKENIYSGLVLCTYIHTHSDILCLLTTMLSPLSFTVIISKAKSGLFCSFLFFSFYFLFLSSFFLSSFGLFGYFSSSIGFLTTSLCLMFLVIRD